MRRCEKKTQFPPVFTPLNKERLSELSRRKEHLPIPPYDLSVISIEGPNGVGKSAVLNSALEMVQMANNYIYENQPCPPLVGVAEPPDMPVDPANQKNRTDTYRSLIKSGISKDDVLDPDLLKDPLFQAGLFLWARRRIEEEAFLNFPLSPTRSGPHWIFPPGRRHLSQIPYRTEDLKKIGSAALVKDRGTMSTVVFQGTHPEQGSIVRRLITNLYEENFLIKESMTIVIFPYDPTSRIDEEQRDVGEPDIHARKLDEIALYAQLCRKNPPFTQRIIRLRNDPTGENNNLSTTALLTSFLIVAEMQKVQNGLESLPIGLPFKIEFPFVDLLRQMQITGRGKSKRLLSDFLSEETDFSEDKLRPQSSEFLYANGDVGVMEIDKKQNTLKLLIQPGLCGTF